MAMFFITLLVVLACTEMCFSSSTKEKLSEKQWITVSKCRAYCIENHLSLEESSENTDLHCKADSTGCNTCWLMCEMLVRQPEKWGFSCSPEIPTTLCNSGCKTACISMDIIDQHHIQDPVTSKLQPTVQFYNDSSLIIDVDFDRYDSVIIYLVFFKYSASNEEMGVNWKYFTVSAYGQIPVYGQYKKYNELAFRVIAIGKDSVFSVAEVDIMASLADQEYTTAMDTTTEEYTTEDILIETSTNIIINKIYHQDPENDIVNTEIGYYYTTLDIIGTVFICSYVVILFTGILIVCKCKNAKSCKRKTSINRRCTTTMVASEHGYSNRKYTDSEIGMNNNDFNVVDKNTCVVTNEVNA